MNHADEAEQLAFLEPCPICDQLTIGPQSGVVGVYGVESHRNCYQAVLRWYMGDHNWASCECRSHARRQRRARHRWTRRDDTGRDLRVVS